MSEPTPANDPETLRLCREAIIHCLDAIASDPRKFWLMGSLTGSREKLLAAYAALTGKTAEEVKDSWLPDPDRYEDYCRRKEEDERLVEKVRDSSPIQIHRLEEPDDSWKVIGWAERLLRDIGGPDALHGLGFTEPERMSFMSALHPSY